jgi:hypothetical protein
MKYLVALALLLLNLAHAEVIPIAPVETCFLCSSAPSMTMYWKGNNAKAVLIFIPGGEGYMGLKEDQTEIKGQLLLALKRLTHPEQTSGNFDVVLLDSPGELSPRQMYPSARGSFDHLIRIESAIRYYKTKTGLPVWLMGHSNGGISLSEFIKYAQKNGKMDLISGVINSGISTESYFNAPISFPMLFIHHQNDACQHCLPSAALANYEKVKKFNTGLTEFVYVTTGSAQAADLCRSGFHMYNGAGEEAAKYMDEFMSKVYLAKPQSSNP